MPPTQVLAGAPPQRVFLLDQRLRRTRENGIPGIEADYGRACGCSTSQVVVTPELDRLAVRLSFRQIWTSHIAAGAPGPVSLGAPKRTTKRQHSQTSKRDWRGRSTGPVAAVAHPFRGFVRSSSGEIGICSSSSPGGSLNGPLFQSAAFHASFASSILSFEDDTKFHQM